MGAPSSQGKGQDKTHLQMQSAQYPGVFLCVHVCKRQAEPPWTASGYSPGVVDPGEAIGKEAASSHERSPDQSEDEGPGALLPLRCTWAEREASWEDLPSPGLSPSPMPNTWPGCCPAPVLVLTQHRRLTERYWEPKGF
jgi:hypothetical protein